jgi:F-type H+-transporting ATPase subunit alpha
MKQVAGSLRLDLAQYRELAAFAQFGSDLDKSTLQKLARGARLTELLKQPQYNPMSAEQQVASIFMATKGFMDDIPVAAVARCESEFLEYMKTSEPAVLEDIRTKKQLDKDLEGRLQAAVTAFKKGFSA